MSTEHQPAPAYLCTGSDCRKRAGDAAALRAVLDDAGVPIEEVRCQKLCKGPVVGLVIDDTVQWFGKLRGKGGRKALRRFLKKGDGPLWKMRDKKRAGKMR